MPITNPEEQGVVAAFNSAGATLTFTGAAVVGDLMWATISLGNTVSGALGSTNITDNVCSGPYTMIDSYYLASAREVAHYYNVVTTAGVPSVVLAGLPGSVVGGAFATSRFTGFTGTPTLAATEVAKVNGSLTAASFTGTIATNVLTITTFTSGTLSVGDEIYSGAGVTAGTTISSYGTGTGTSTGTYNLSASSTVSTAEAMLSSTRALGPALTTSHSPELLVGVLSGPLYNHVFGQDAAGWTNNGQNAQTAYFWNAVTAVSGTAEKLTSDASASTPFVLLNAGFYNGAPLSSPGPLPRSIFIMP